MTSVLQRVLYPQIICGHVGAAGVTSMLSICIFLFLFYSCFHLYASASENVCNVIEKPRVYLSGDAFESSIADVHLFNEPTWERVLLLDTVSTFRADSVLFDPVLLSDHRKSLYCTPPCCPHWDISTSFRCKEDFFFFIFKGC